MSEPRQPKGLSLKNVPPDIFSILINEQTKIKLATGRGQFGLEQVVYKLIRAAAKKPPANDKS